MIHVKNLTKRYGDTLAVDHVSFDIEDGKIYGFLGPNGAGKSTTMNMITGCLCATEGSVLINGKDIVKDPIEAKRNIGYLPEIPPLYPDMTPHEYLTFVAEAKGLDAEQTYRKVNEVMALTSLTDVADRLIANLSKGYCQRVGIAQALLGDPGIIILDEPTVGLDPKQIIEIRDLIRTLGKTKTVILSSHILAEISAVCDHIMILSAGKLVANDTPEELERSMNATGKLEFSAKCDLEDGIRVLETVEEIDRYTADFFDGYSHFALDSDGTTDLRETIFFAFAKAGYPIVHLASRHLTLEDIFLKLTTPQVDEETLAPENEEDAVDDGYVPLFSTDEVEDKNDEKEEDEI